MERVGKGVGVTSAVGSEEGGSDRLCRCDKNSRAQQTDQYCHDNSDHEGGLALNCCESKAGFSSPLDLKSSGMLD